MDMTALYNIAKGFVNKIKHEKPAFAEGSGSALCLILTEDEQIFSGISGMGIQDGNIVNYPAESIALTAMFSAGKYRAKQIMLLSIEDCSVSAPCTECLNMLLHLDKDNELCEAAISEEKSVTVKKLLSGDISEESASETSDKDSDEASGHVDYFSGFGDSDEGGAAPADMFQGGFDESYSAPQHEPVKKDTGENASLGAPAEFSSGVAIDESNPFYAPPKAASDTDPAPAEPAKKTGGARAAAEADAAAQNSKNLSKEELLQQAKQRKKIAKANFNFFKNKS